MHRSATHSHNDDPVKLTGSWELADVVDFEFLLEQDLERPLAELDSRDQSIAQTLAAVHDSATNDRRGLFRGWLEQRRAATADLPLPGQTAMAAWSLLLKILMIAAVLLGGATAFNLLRYNGTEPINVASYLGWLVLVQIGLISLALLLALLRKLGWFSTEASLLTGIIRSGWSALAVRLNRHLLDRAPAERRLALESFMGSSGAFKKLYGGVAIWPLVGALQWFGIFFNIAAIVTTLALIVFSDRAFGWQSAVNFSPVQVHELTQLLAAPWSWAISSAAAPTLAQVAGSKIVLKDGIRQLATENLVAWWPFLIASVFTYGFLPRFLLWILTIVMERRALRSIAFEHVACDRLYERLTAHRLQSQAIDAEPLRTSLDDGNAVESDTPKSQSGVPTTPDEAVILINDDLRKQLDEPEFKELLLARFKLNPFRWLTWSESSDTRKLALEELDQFRSRERRPRLVILEEAWQPPIAEKLDGLRVLRNTTGPDAKLIVLLIGRPNGTDFLTPVKPADLQVWRGRLQTLADPQLRVETLVN